MKKLVILILLSALSGNAMAWGYGPLARDPYDKASHAIAGMAIRKAIGDEHPILGAAAAILVGYLKEKSDKHFDTMDLAAWSAGVHFEIKF